MDEFFHAVEHSLKKSWPGLLVLIFGYLLWSHGLLHVFFESWFFPILATILIGRIAWIWWIHYIQEDFISGIDFVLLEIIPPREVLRSPKAMELFFTNALYHWSNKSGLEEFWQGAVWFWFSLEIASIDGQVHFYIRTPTRVRPLIETQMYAQYPQSQIKVVEDYTLAVPEITPEGAWNGWGCEFKLKKPEAFPIKTYVDFGLDKDPKEEVKVDPISPVIELFSSMQKGEQMWMQIIVTPSKKMYHTHGTWFGHHDWVEESRRVIEDLLQPFTRYHQRPEGAPGAGSFSIELRQPDFLKNAVSSMSAKTTKLGFETGIRVMYVGKKEVYDLNKRRTLRLAFRQYAKPDCNELERCNSTQADAYSGVFLASPKTVMFLANRMLTEYRERMFFHLTMRQHIFSQKIFRWPIPDVFTLDALIKAYFTHRTFVMNVEELATMWHFPGQILKVPTLERIESKEASPPTNLPI